MDSRNWCYFTGVLTRIAEDDNSKYGAMFNNSQNASGNKYRSRSLPGALTLNPGNPSWPQWLVKCVSPRFGGWTVSDSAHVLIQVVIFEFIYWRSHGTNRMGWNTSSRIEAYIRWQICRVASRTLTVD